MNHIAERIGADDSSFVEPSGLLAANKSTVEDMVRITREAARHPIFTEMANREKSEIKLEQISRARKIIRWIRGNNTNPFAHEDNNYEIIVAKTGLTRAAGWCLTMMFKYQGRTYIMVTAGNRDKFARKKIADYLIALVTDDRYRIRIQEENSSLY
jgi:D-alanyl-D-alanine endopeptidase (penicillin-binding protein 7)